VLEKTYNWLLGGLQRQLPQVDGSLGCSWSPDVISMTRKTGCYNMERVNVIFQEEYGSSLATFDIDVWNLDRT